jgi:hypothetical protein
LCVPVGIFELTLFLIHKNLCNPVCVMYGYPETQRPKS